ncbi:IS21 family transposase, partial [Actinospica durhamensis]|nr:IS21 family transposase [Actinospica durhamensis]
GGVEHEGGRFRRKHLVPVAEVDSLAELNERLERIDLEEEARFVHGNPATVGFRFREEASLLHPLPAEEFDCGLTLTPLVRKDSRVVVRQSYYSVPARFIGARVRVSLRANDLLVFDGPRVVARHPRLTHRYAHSDVLDHYLEILNVKPGALAGSAALAQARKQGAFTALHDAYWAAARKAHGDAAGTRALIEVLLLYRRMPKDAVDAGLRAAVQAGASSPELVAIEARRAEGDQGAQGVEPAPAQPADQGEASTPGNVLTLRPRQLSLPADRRPLPSVAAYDQLLTYRSKGSSAS